jgi:hypothetical protein
MMHLAQTLTETKKSWLSLSDFVRPITCPEGVYRKTLTLYYLTPPREGLSDRGKALFAPHENQKGNIGSSFFCL